MIADPFAECNVSLKQKMIEMIDAGVDELREEAISRQRQFQMFGTHVKAKMDQKERHIDGAGESARKKYL